MTLAIAPDQPGVQRPSSPLRRHAPFLLIAPALIFLFVFLVLPYFNIIVMSLRVPARVGMYAEGFTHANYARALTDGFYMGVLGQTLLVGLLTTVACVLFGVPIAYHLGRSRSRWSGVLYTLILSPLLVGVVVRTFGWLIILSGNGVANKTLREFGLIEAPLRLMNNEFGVVLALTHVLLPLMILPLLGNVQAINPNLERAARSLGAGRLTVFWRIGLPLCMPGIQAGGILVFILAISAFVTPAMLGGPQVRTMSVLIVQQLIDNFQWPFGAALALILATATSVSVLLYIRFTAPLLRGLR
ncbi:MAG: ABC transporter permease [Alphaproteobacteria bacterium]|nr:ABC transporter permease [Alphaproteobacteria bacterium]